MKTAIINSNSKNTRMRSIYDPKLDEFSGKIIFKEKFESAKKLLANTTIPKEILEKINKEFNK
jgi:hypothetical protein